MSTGMSPDPRTVDFLPLRRDRAEAASSTPLKPGSQAHRRKAADQSPFRSVRRARLHSFGTDPRGTMVVVDLAMHAVGVIQCAFVVPKRAFEDH